MQHLGQVASSELLVSDLWLAASSASDGRYGTGRTCETGNSWRGITQLGFGHRKSWDFTWVLTCFDEISPCFGLETWGGLNRFDSFLSKRVEHAKQSVCKLYIAALDLGIRIQFVSNNAHPSAEKKVNRVWVTVSCRIYTSPASIPSKGLYCTSSAIPWLSCCTGSRRIEAIQMGSQKPSAKVPSLNIHNDTMIQYMESFDNITTSDSMTWETCALFVGHVVLYSAYPTC